MNIPLHMRGAGMPPPFCRHHAPACQLHLSTWRTHRSHPPTCSDLPQLTFEPFKEASRLDGGLEEARAVGVLANYSPPNMIKYRPRGSSRPQKRVIHRGIDPVDPIITLYSIIIWP